MDRNFNVSWKYELCERLSDYVKENLAPVEVVKMVDSKEKLS